MEVEAAGYHTKQVSFTVPEYKNTYPKLTFLEIKLQNSSLPTTTEETTTAVVTTPLPQTTVNAFVNNRFGSVEDIDRGPVESDVQMLRGGGCQTAFVQQMLLESFLVTYILLYLY